MDDNLKNNTYIKTPYGLKDGKIILINELSESDRGQKCNCLCPVCKMPLNAKLGYGKKTPHFAHSNFKCNNNKISETGLHLLAKDILFELKEIRIPKVEKFLDYNLDGYPNYIREKITTKILISDETYIKIDKVISEHRIDDIIPDILLFSHNNQLLIEIAVTHFVDQNKLSKIKKHGISTIEIDLSQFIHEQPERKIIKHQLIDSIENKKWLYNKKLDEKIKEVDNINKIILKDYTDFQIKKKEAERDQKKIIVDKINMLLNPNKFVESFNMYRNDLEFTDFFKNNSKLLNIFNDVIPYYIDIPITGEFVFKTDRRIWQTYIFYNFIYLNKTNFICLETITENIKSTKLFEIDWNIGKKINLGGKLGEVSLFYYVIKTYINLLTTLGFIVSNKQIKHRRKYPIISGKIKPPNEENNKTLKSFVNEISIKVPFYEVKLISNLFSSISQKSNEYHVKLLSSQQNYYVEKQRLKIEQIKIERDRTIIQKNENLKIGLMEIDPKYDWSSESLNIDRFNNKWIKCTICNNIKDSNQMTTYKYSQGICSECMKK